MSEPCDPAVDGILRRCGGLHANVQVRLKEGHDPDLSVASDTYAELNQSILLPAEDQKAQVQNLEVYQQHLQPLGAARKPELALHVV